MQWRDVVPCTAVNIQKIDGSGTAYVLLTYVHYCHYNCGVTQNTLRDYDHHKEFIRHT